MSLCHKPRWNTRIAIVDGAVATPRVHRTLGTLPTAKRVRFNPQTAIRPIPSGKEVDVENPVTSTTAQTPQAFTTTAADSAFMERPPLALPKESDF